MIYGLCLTAYVILCFSLMGLILIQKSKGSLGIGSLGGSMQMLFGGSGGQTFLQKMTWVFGALFMALSLSLAILKSRSVTRYYANRPIPAQSRQLPAAPMSQSVPTQVPEQPQSTPPAEQVPAPEQA